MCKTWWWNWILARGLLSFAFFVIRVPKSGVNFINVLGTTFVHVDPKSVKRYWQLDCVLTLSGSMSAKADHRCQFHQCSTYSFCARRSRRCKKILMTNCKPSISSTFFVRIFPTDVVFKFVQKFALLTLMNWHQIDLFNREILQTKKQTK